MLLFTGVSAFIIIIFRLFEDERATEGEMAWKQGRTTAGGVVVKRLRTAVLQKEIIGFNSLFNSRSLQKCRFVLTKFPPFFKTVDSC